MEPRVSKPKLKVSQKREEESSYSECMLAKVIAKLAVGEQYHDPEIEQGIDQRIDQEIDQRIDQEIDQRIDQEIDQRIDQEIDQRIDQEIDQRIDQRIDQEFAQPQHKQSKAKKKRLVGLRKAR